MRHVFSLWFQSRLAAASSGAGGALWLSTDGGASWQELDAPAYPAQPEPHDGGPPWKLTQIWSLARSADALWAGIVDAYVPSAKINALQDALGAADLSGPDSHRNVDKVIAGFAEDAGMPSLPAMMRDIDRCFSAETLQEIEANLEKLGGEWAAKQLAALRKLSPLSMAITLEQMKRCANRSFEDTMTIEYRMSQECMRPDHDFFEGVRALLNDKDQKPKWNPPSIDGVTRQMVEAHFRPLKNDLFFD